MLNQWPEIGGQPVALEGDEIGNPASLSLHSYPHSTLMSSTTCGPQIMQRQHFEKKILTQRLRLKQTVQAIS